MATHLCTPQMQRGMGNVLWQARPRQNDVPKRRRLSSLVSRFLLLLLFLATFILSPLHGCRASSGVFHLSPAPTPLGRMSEECRGCFDSSRSYRRNLPTIFELPMRTPSQRFSVTAKRYFGASPNALWRLLDSSASRCLFVPTPPPPATTRTAHDQKTAPPLYPSNSKTSHRISIGRRKLPFAVLTPSRWCLRPRALGVWSAVRRLFVSRLPKALGAPPASALPRSARGPLDAGTPPGATALLWVNGLTFVVDRALNGALTKLLARDDRRIAQPHGELWRLLTASVLHANVVPHLVGNMQAIKYVAANAERQFGTATMAAIYITGVFSGNLLSFLVNLQMGPRVIGSTRGVGASGGILGLNGALLVHLYRRYCASAAAGVSDIPRLEYVESLKMPPAAGPPSGGSASASASARRMFIFLRDLLPRPYNRPQLSLPHRGHMQGDSAASALHRLATSTAGGLVAAAAAAGFGGVDHVAHIGGLAGGCAAGLLLGNRPLAAQAAHAHGRAGTWWKITYRCSIFKRTMQHLFKISC
eukprot:GHVT01046670.1.p1 GENE.GHVT01046670.1~~GHVT01046670.1.p1  ORF type:complete len:532 (+),score=57.74 GHVT01046670.1:449-2044(+)